MIRPWGSLCYVGFIFRDMAVGTIDVMREAFGPSRAKPMVVEFPMRCATDVEITTLAASITITPGTLVLGIADARGSTPPTLFVHSLFFDSPDELLSELRDMETHLLRMTRGRYAPAKDEIPSYVGTTKGGTS